MADDPTPPTHGLSGSRELREEDTAKLQAETWRRINAPDRYEHIGVLGRGGMGEVFRVRDNVLKRDVAMKVIRLEVLDNPRSVARFIDEAQAASQLNHPGIVPVHDIGRLPDGRWYYTMPQIQGRSLGTVVKHMHQTSGANPGGWTLRRLLQAFAQVCEAVAYAHQAGVIHRDIKPSNVMLGSHGEVFIVDWGIAKIIGGGQGLVETDRSSGNIETTQVGRVVGTPAYMPPEQARGELIDERIDVYALGATLFAILAGKAPYKGLSVDDLLATLRSGPTPPVPEEAPQELVAICQHAMAPNPKDRHATASALAKDVYDWLDGATKRDHARGLVEQANLHLEAANSAYMQAGIIEAQARQALESLNPSAPEQDKTPGWRLEDQAETTRHQARLEMVEHEQLLQGALSHDPTLPEAHAALANLLLKEHAEAEVQRSLYATAKAEAALKRHAQALPQGDATRVGVTAYLKGDGALTLVTDPPGAEVMLYRYEAKSRRLQPTFVVSLGTTPIRRRTLPKGSYLAVLKRKGRIDVNYPFVIGRQAHWHGRPPDEKEPLPIVLPREGSMEPEDCYVPAGWFTLGGDDRAPTPFPAQQVWGEAFVIKKFPVTNSLYLAFLNDLVGRGMVDEALKWVPRTRGGTLNQLGAIIYGQHEDGRFYLRPDAEGDMWIPEYPVLMVDWFSAKAHADWQAKRSMQPWRLPTEVEWEHAARGADGRFFPWGDNFDPTWCNMADSHQEGPLLAKVDTFPADCSPYGVRGLAGNVRDWCRTIYDDPEDRTPTTSDQMIARGGAWYHNVRYSRSADRYWHASFIRNTSLGFRLARSVNEDLQDEPLP